MDVNVDVNSLALRSHFPGCKHVKPTAYVQCVVSGTNEPSISR